jgi:heat shock protein HslJ
VPPGFSKVQDAEPRLVRLRLDKKDISISADARITLTFRKGGQISGRFAINNYAGVFTITADAGITINVTTSAQMAGPAELMELENHYFDRLSRIQKIVLKSDRVILENEKTFIEFVLSPSR